MKSEEQVLKEIALDAIKFSVGHRTTFTRLQFEILVKALKQGQTSVSLPVKKQTSRWASPGMQYKFHLFDEEEFGYVYRLSRRKRNKGFLNVRNLARFETIEELTDYMAGINRAETDY